MALNTHSDFKSNYNVITTADDLFLAFEQPFLHQHKYELKIPREEENFWRGKDINNFRISVESIDRLYYIINTKDNFNLIARMDYNGLSLYVQISGQTLHTGAILISPNFNRFIKNLNASENIKLFIKNQMQKNGTEIMIQKIDSMLEKIECVREELKHIKMTLTEEPEIVVIEDDVGN